MNNGRIRGAVGRRDDIAGIRQLEWLENDQQNGGDIWQRQLLSYIVVLL